MSKVRVAIIGVGNCASSLVQGVEYYKKATEKDSVPGLMHVNLGGYHISDIEFSAAIDIATEEKSGLGCSLAGPWQFSHCTLSSRGTAVSS